MVHYVQTEMRGEAMEKTAQTEKKLLWAAFLLWFSVYTYPSFLSSYVQNELQAGAVLIGAITGSYGFTQMILRIPLGIWSDLIKKRRVFMTGGAAVGALSALGLMLSHTAGAVLVFRGLSGVAASTWVMYSVMYSNCVPEERLGRAMSTLSFYQYGSQVIAMIGGALLADRIGKQAAFGLAFAAGAAGVILTLTIEEPPAYEGRMTLRDFSEVLKSRRLISATVLSTVFHFTCWGTVLGFTVNWASGVIGLSTTLLGFLSAAYLVPNTIVSKCAGHIEKLTGRRALMTCGFVIVAAASALYGCTVNALSLFAVQIMFGCGMGMILPMTMAEAVTGIPNEKRGAAMGFYQSIYGVGMFLGPLIAGGVVNSAADVISGYKANFLLMAAVAVAGAVLAFILTDKKGRK